MRQGDTDQALGHVPGFDGGDQRSPLFEGLQETMRAHAHEYEQLSPAAQAELSAQAAAHVAATHAAIEGQVTTCQRDIDALRQRRLVRERVHGLPNHVGARRFTDDEVQRVAEMLESPAFSSLQVPSESNKARLRFPPEAPPQDVQDAFEEVAEQLGPAGDVQPPAPAWCRHICRNHELFGALLPE